MIDRSPFRLAGVPVFLYHGLINRDDDYVPSPERRYCLKAPQFYDQLKHIRENDYQFVLLREWWDGTGVFAEDKARVAITFDDGRESNYRIAYPLLSDAGARADFFINTASVGQKGFLSWSQIAEMRRAGMGFQSHGRDHVNLASLSLAALEEQLKASKHCLEDRLGCAVEFLAVPYGALSSRVLSVAKRQGYRAVCTSWSWPARPGLQTVNRVVVYRHTTLQQFHRLLVGEISSYLVRAARAALIYVPKRLLLRSWPPFLGIRVVKERI